ncbi:ATP-grasp domain-containing protein [Bradyrhizobium sp. BR 1433]|uniref:ATP-binding protein n=1 Tax=Bradyrhizobium sp. BR 1433 TaxID=3447967 RepID=UPI003EE4E92F
MLRLLWRTICASSGQVRTRFARWGQGEREADGGGGGLANPAGSDAPTCDLADAAAAAAAIGYPVVLKAVLGGGGRGMRRVATKDHLPAAVEEVRHEAIAAFGREDFYVEKYLDNIRHIEVQLIGDQHGNLMSLGTRECSVQRNHQKVVEEAPARLGAALEGQLNEAACRLGSHIGYDSAGTVEFLVDREGAWYFIEMNTRIQVEHTITEAITGIDIIELMLQSASSSPLAVNELNIRFNGHAMEFRVCAEDPFNAFRPELGTVELLRLPSGPGIRLDSGIEQHCKLSVHFDSLCAKLTFWGPTRQVALTRARIGFEEFGLVGFQTNVPFHKWLMQQPEFIAGDYDLSLVNRFSSVAPIDGEDLALHLIAALLADNDLRASRRPHPNPGVHPSGWQLANEEWSRGKF